MRYWIAGVSLVACLVSAPALAVSAQRHQGSHSLKVSSAKDITVDKQTMPDLGTMVALIDKMFPQQPDPDPARLALAHSAVNVMWPDGSYGKMLSGFFGGMISRAMELKQSDLTGITNTAAKPKGTTAHKEESLHDTFVAKDPYFDQRMAAVRQAIDEEAAKVSAVVDPRMRDGLSRAFARKLDEHQLADVNAFFATPSGRAFAGQYLQLWLDPDAMRSMMGAMPDLMRLMPEAMQKIKEANDKFPKPPKEPQVPAKK